MFPSPACPRAGQSGLWQDWACGAIGASPRARSGDHARRGARWTRAFQVVTPPAPRFPGVLPLLQTVESISEGIRFGLLVGLCLTKGPGVVYGLAAAGGEVQSPGPVGVGALGEQAEKFLEVV